MGTNPSNTPTNSHCASPSLHVEATMA